jgi:hypothetical protein
MTDSNSSYSSGIEALHRLKNSCQITEIGPSLLHLANGTEYSFIEVASQTTKISSILDIKANKRTSPISFVICNSCYWCATYFGIDASSSSLLCHGCNSHDTELLPISTDESFRIEYDPIRSIASGGGGSGGIIITH